jgi:hypothetical protein
MRLFYFLILFSLPFAAFAAPCTDANFAGASPANNYYLCDSLTLSTTGINKKGDGNPDPIFIEVTGDVVINANIIIDGNDGRTILGDNDFTIPGGPGSGGPGGWSGGGINSSTAEPGQGVSGQDGTGGLADTSGRDCGSGGGAAANKTNGTQGNVCFDGSSGTDTGLPGTAIGTFPHNPTNPPTPFDHFGGYGGGAGGPKAQALNIYDLGSGGGGGGGIYIKATGTISIGNGVRISARGGAGGKSAFNGGGGGGGSGGTILLESPVSITNKGIFDARGGQSGSTRSASPHGGAGGTGGDGFVRLEINGVPNDLPTAYQDFSTPVGNLKSDITCGTIAKKNENQNLMFQMMVGFSLVTLLSLFSKKRKFSFQK